MTLTSDIKAVRHELEICGRAVNKLIDDKGRSCLRQAMLSASFDQDHDEWVRRDKAMHDALVKHVPAGVVEAFPDAEYYPLAYTTVLSLFNDRSDDQDVFDLIDKAMAETGGL